MLTVKICSEEYHCGRSHRRLITLSACRHMHAHAHAHEHFFCPFTSIFGVFCAYVSRLKCDCRLPIVSQRRRWISRILFFFLRGSHGAQRFSHLLSHFVYISSPQTINHVIQLFVSAYLTMFQTPYMQYFGPFEIFRSSPLQIRLTVKACAKCIWVVMDISNFINDLGH